MERVRIGIRHNGRVASRGNGNNKGRSARRRNNMWHYNLAKYRERVQFWIAWHMPRWLVYFCSIRLMSNATVGKYGDTIVPELMAMDALERWEHKEL